MKFRKINFIDFESKNVLTKKTWLVIIMFISVVFVYNALMVPGSLIITFINMANHPEINPLETDATMQLAYLPNAMIYSLFATAFGIITALLYVKFLEQRKLSSAGIVKKNFIKQYALGYLLGIIMISLPAIAIALYNGKVVFNSNSNIAILFVYFLGFMVQGASEEIIFRGYLLTSLAKAKNIFWAVIISSVLFALVHSLNPNMGWLPALNLFLYGVFAALIFLRTKNIWLISALHSAWNYFQGNIFGIEVSGQILSGSLLNVSSKCPDILSGGDFGLEGGLFVTIVLITASIMVMYAGKSKLMVKKYEYELREENV